MSADGNAKRSSSEKKNAALIIRERRECRITCVFGGGCTKGQHFGETLSITAQEFMWCCGALCLPPPPSGVSFLINSVLPPKFGLDPLLLSPSACFFVLCSRPPSCQTLCAFTFFCKQQWDEGESQHDEG